MEGSKMSLPMWVLLGFAAWTVITLLVSVAPYRWSRILTRRARINDFPADRVEGSDFYRRAMQAHANCVENLPVFGAVVVAGEAVSLNSEIYSALAVIFVAARIGQTLVHLSVPQTEKVVSVRFTFFLSQLICVGWMGILVAVKAVGLH